MFFRPGERGAYYQWFVEFPRCDKITAVPWDSPHRHYRSLEEFATIDTKTLEDGFVACITIPWVMLYDKLPRNGDLWPFTLQRWSRLGSVTWGGKVHEINRFGRVEWQGLSPELELDIKRNLLLKAWARYRSARAALANHWRDEMIGDPPFFHLALKARFEQLDAFGERVSADMPAETVREVFDAAVADWMEIEYVVAEQRSAWLRDALFDAEIPSSRAAGE